jgi:hypothetical protein
VNNTQRIASLRRLSRDRGATPAERANAKDKADALEYPGRGLSDAELEAKLVTARLEAADAEAKAKKADSERIKLEKLRNVAANALSQLTAEMRLRQELKLRKLSDDALGQLLVNGGDHEMAARAEVARRRKLQIAERMRNITLHQLCTIFFEQRKQRDYWDYTHKDDEREAAQTEIRRRIKKPELGALSDQREAADIEVEVDALGGDAT